MDDDCNHPLISIIYTPAYTEGCTCLVTKSIVLQNYGQLLLTVEHKKRGERQSLMGGFAHTTKYHQSLYNTEYFRVSN